MQPLTQTPEQLLLREEAAAANPAFATLEGRAMQDVHDTIAYLAVGLRPETVLGGLMRTQFGLFDSSYLQRNDRGAIQIGVDAHVDPIRPNERGDRVADVLEGLVSLGFVERVFVPGSVEAALLPDDDRRKMLNVPTYRLSTENLPSGVLDVLTRVEATDAKLKAERAEREARASRPRRGLLRRRQA